MVFLYLISKGCENMEKSLEQLKQEYEKTTVLLEQEKRKMQRLKNRQAYLESGSRKQRTHRLITRGAANACRAWHSFGGNRGGARA